MKSKEHPLQPLEIDEYGTLRFKKNAIVKHLLDKGGIDLNEIACMEFPQNDREQFAQLIGYSLSGFSELGYVRDTTYEMAEQSARKKSNTPEQQKISVLEKKLAIARKATKQLAAGLFRISADDLEGD